MPTGERDLPYNPADVAKLEIQLQRKISASERLNRQQQALNSLLNNFKSYVIDEDDFLLILNKPPGVSAHFNRSHAVGVREIAKYRKGVHVEIAHRLDIDTSGLMVLTKHPGVFEEITKQFGNKDTYAVRKVYLAYLENHLVVSQPRKVKVILKIHERHSEVFADGTLARATSGLRDSETIYHSSQLLRRSAADYSKVAIQLITGRMHQIRAVSAYLGHPVASDTMYGAKHLEPYRTMLHASEIEFWHPGFRDHVSYHASIPADMQRFEAECEEIPTARSRRRIG